MKEWQQRPLDEVCPFVWLDAIHHKIKDNGRYVSTPSGPDPGTFFDVNI